MPFAKVHDAIHSEEVFRRKPNADPREQQINNYSRELKAHQYWRRHVGGRKSERARETLTIYCWLLNLKYYVARLGSKGEKEENRTIEIKYFSRFGGGKVNSGGDRNVQSRSCIF